jgi:hypothetical protein
MKKKIKDLQSKSSKNKISVRIDNPMPDLSKDSFVLAKKEKAEKLLSKYPVPESFLHKPKPRPKANTSLKRKA